MSRVVKIGAAGVIGFMTATSVFALTTAEAMDEFDLLAISEAPLTEFELGEARGGFSFGGFDFKFGVDIAPVTVENPASSGMFGDGGLFGDDGVFGNDGGPIGQDGVFGESGVFGQNNTTANDQQSAAVDNSPFQAPAQPAAFENTMAEVVQQPSVSPAPEAMVQQPVASPAPEAMVQQPSASPASEAMVQQAAASPAPEAMVQQAAPIVADTPVVASNTVPAVAAPSVAASVVQDPVSIVVDAVAEKTLDVAVAQVAGEIVEAALTPVAAPAAIVEAAVAPVPQSPASNAPKPQNNVDQQPDAAEAAPVQRAVTQRITQTTTMSGRTFVVNNNVNGAKFTQSIDINVAIPNFDSRINRAVADAAVATIISANYILGQIQ